ncbi:cysteine and histidine-rich domain-containing protein 1 [Lepisosteus oculatus]|uniref:cysteine and histidine-rich domain-containing protein 1 n=1 Tax=Lepisosteus oculatus TaxID=7918 RepID=UPI003716D587
MAVLCYNKGCGERFNPEDNSDDVCLHHPGVPIFHDALKGWSCCRKRTTDFSEFLSIKGCARGRHSNVKPQEPLRPEVTSNKADDLRPHAGHEIIFTGPKSAEALKKERPSSEEPKIRLPVKVSQSLTQALEKLMISETEKTIQQDGAGVAQGTRCKNAGCKTIYDGPKTDAEPCNHHPGVPVFHEGYKYWSCCCIKTTDFNAFLDQKGCSTGKHRWVPRQDKKTVACRYDWHQTSSQVVVTVYAKNAMPDQSYVEANRTVMTVHIQFEGDKVFHKDFHLWGVANVDQSFASMVPSKVEVTLRKADAVSWAKLEDPRAGAGTEPAPEAQEQGESEEQSYDWDISDDDISDSEEEEVRE